LSNKKFVYKKGFLHFEPNEDAIITAYKRSLSMGILPGSYTKGAGNMVGCLGEVAVELYLRNSIYVGDTEFNYDFLYRKKKVEVKSKSCGGLPKLSYSAFINGKKSKVDSNDIYFFTRVKRDLSMVYLLGWLPSKEIDSVGVYRQKGDVDKDNFVFRSKGYQIIIDSLRKPKSIKKA